MKAKDDKRYEVRMREIIKDLDSYSYVHQDKCKGKVPDNSPVILTQDNNEQIPLEKLNLKNICTDKIETVDKEIDCSLPYTDQSGLSRILTTKSKEKLDFVQKNILSIKEKQRRSYERTKSKSQLKPLTEKSILKLGGNSKWSLHEYDSTPSAL